MVAALNDLTEAVMIGMGIVTGIVIVTSETLMALDIDMVVIGVVAMANEIATTRIDMTGMTGRQKVGFRRLC